MADEINVRTIVTYSDDDGTIYNRDISFYSDDNTTASRPKRFTFVASDVGEYSVLDTSTTAEWKQQLKGAAMVLLINRDTSKSMRVKVSTASMTRRQVLRPKSWIYFDVMEGDEGTIGGGGAFTYGSEPITAIAVSCEFGACKGELLTIYKAAS